MNNDQLRQFIEQNREEFDKYPISQEVSHKFQTKITNNNRSQHKLRYAVAIPAIVATCIILLFLLLPGKDKKGEITTIYPEYLSVQEYENQSIRDLEQLAAEILSQSRELYPDNTYEIEGAIDGLTHDAIFMYQQLPFELSEQEQIRIIKDYYDQKRKGLEQFRLFITQNNE